MYQKTWQNTPAPETAANELPQKASWVAEIAKYNINNYFLLLTLFSYHMPAVLNKHPLSFSLI